MRLGTAVGLAIVLFGSTACVRLGFWQLSRWEEKKALNAALRAAAGAPPLIAASEPPSLERVRGRYVMLRGRYDQRRQILLSGRAHDGSPGVEVVTPLLLPGGRAVLVDRGWLYAPDAARARPQDYPEWGWVEVVGFVEPLRSGAGGAPLRTLEVDTLTLWSARWLDRDTLASRLPYPFAPYLVRQAPGPGVPARPARAHPRPHNESMHLGYAVQWFLFAAIQVGGAAALAWSRRRTRRRTDSAGRTL